jgi:hypothetical protein
MAQGTIFQLPIDRTWNADGTKCPGAKLSVQLAGTTTATSLFLDVGLTLACATPSSPLVADANGVFVEVFATPGVAYKVTLTDANNVALPGYPADNVLAVPASSATVDQTETAGVSLTAGQVAYISDGSGGLTPGLLYAADPANQYSSVSPLVGMVPSAITSGSSGTLRISGQVTGLTGLTPGADYYAGNAGTLTSTAPSNARWIGRADSTTSIVINPNPPPAVAGAGLDLLQIEALS